MPLPTQITQATSQEIYKSVTATLVKDGVTPRSEAVQALEDHGIDTNFLAGTHASLLQSSKEGVKMKALEMAYGLKGISLRPEEVTAQVPSISINIHGGDVQALAAMYAPQRSS